MNRYCITAIFRRIHENWSRPVFTIVWNYTVELPHIIASVNANSTKMPQPLSVACLIRLIGKKCKFHKATYCTTLQWSPSNIKKSHWLYLIFFSKTFGQQLIAWFMPVGNQPTSLNHSTGISFMLHIRQCQKCAHINSLILVKNIQASELSHHRDIVSWHHSLNENRHADESTLQY